MQAYGCRQAKVVAKDISLADNAGCQRPRIDSAWLRLLIGTSLDEPAHVFGQRKGRALRFVAAMDHYALCNQAAAVRVNTAWSDRLTQNLKSAHLRPAPHRPSFIPNLIAHFY